MSDETSHTPIEAIEALESGAFRVGQVMRRLLAEHPGLPIRSFRPKVYVYAYLDEEAETTAGVEVSASTVDGVRAWAKALGGHGEVKVDVPPGVSLPFEHAELSTTVDGVQLQVVGTRRLSDEEAAAWRAEQEQPAEDDPVGGGQ